MSWRLAVLLAAGCAQDIGPHLTSATPSSAAHGATVTIAGQRMCDERGLILVDTKYEFGKTKDGRILVIDEIHTPDSSRFWMKDTYDARFAAGQDPEPLDKDFVRRAFIAMGYRGDGPPPAMPDDVRVGAAQRYIEAFERITGKAFTPDLEAPLPRIARNLRARTASA